MDAAIDLTAEEEAPPPQYEYHDDDDEDDDLMEDGGGRRFAAGAAGGGGGGDDLTTVAGMDRTLAETSEELEEVEARETERPARTHTHPTTRSKPPPPPPPRLHTVSRTSHHPCPTDHVLSTCIPTQLRDAPLGKVERECIKIK